MKKQPTNELFFKGTLKGQLEMIQVGGPTLKAKMTDAMTVTIDVPNGIAQDFTEVDTVTVTIKGSKIVDQTLTSNFPWPGGFQITVPGVSFSSSVLFDDTLKTGAATASYYVKDPLFTSVLAQGTIKSHKPPKNAPDSPHSANVLLLGNYMAQSGAAFTAGDALASAGLHGEGHSNFLAAPHAG